MNAFEKVSEIEPAHFRRVMSRFASGVTVILAEADGEMRGMTANAFISGSLEPPLCVVSVTKRAHMHNHLIAAARFSVNILASGQEDYASHFAGRPIPGLEIDLGRAGGVPTLVGVSAWMTADVAATHDCGDHALFIGHIRVMEASEHAPLLYFAGHYAALVPLREETPQLPEFW
jgi:flavin reductase (DIM6/NTAB) family NADH-FMN oxidoreductase RutF